MSKNSPWQGVCSSVDNCALAGAAAMVVSIRGAEVLINGPLWCFYYALIYLGKNKGGLGDRIHNSQPDNKALVYGTEECLLTALATIMKERVPKLLLVENSCSISLIGDDIQGIVRKAGLPCRAVTMDSGGMKGGFREGYRQAFLKLLPVLEQADDEVIPNSVNLIGSSFGYYNGTNDALELKRILEKMGLRVLNIPGVDCQLGVAEDQSGLGSLSRAALNIVTNRELGQELAEKLQQRYGTPYIAPELPYGLQGTKAWIQAVAEAFNNSLSLEPLQQEMAELEERCNDKLSELRLNWSEVWFDRVLIAAPSSIAVAFARALRTEWADTARLTLLCYNRPLEESLFIGIDQLLVADTDGADTDRLWEPQELQGQQLTLFGSNSEASSLYRSGLAFNSCPITYPVRDEALFTSEPYVGLRGHAVMLQRIWNLYIQTKLKDAEAWEMEE